jgi:DNA-binding transcriptional ArsR family regulator
MVGAGSAIGRPLSDGSGASAPLTSRRPGVRWPLDNFYISIIVEIQNRGGGMAKKKTDSEQIPKFADMLAAMGTEPRLRIMQLLLSAHPDGMTVGDIGGELEIPGSTLSHHLDKLKHEDLVQVQREGTFLRYSANCAALEQLLGFLFAECCTRNQAIEPQKIVCCT